MTYKLSVPLCQTFQVAAGQDPDTWLYGRLGLERIQDAPGFPDQAMARWDLTDRTQAQPITDDILAKYIEVGRGTKDVTLEQVAAGLDAVIYTDEFQNSCHERWTALGQGTDTVHVDLAGITDDQAA